MASIDKKKNLKRKLKDEPIKSTNEIAKNDSKTEIDEAKPIKTTRGRPPKNKNEQETKQTQTFFEENISDNNFKKGVSITDKDQISNKHELEQTKKNKRGVRKKSVEKEEPIIKSTENQIVSHSAKNIENNDSSEENAKNASKKGNNLDILDQKHNVFELKDKNHKNIISTSNDEKREKKEIKICVHELESSNKAITETSQEHKENQSDQNEKKRGRGRPTAKKLETFDNNVNKLEEHDFLDTKKASKSVQLKELKEKDEASEPKTTSKRPIRGAAKVAIEHCTSWSVYTRNAKKLIDLMMVDFPEFNYITNEEKPKRNSFEIILKKNDGSSILIWSGMKLGPPRKNKFPEYTIIKEEIQKYL